MSIEYAIIGGDQRIVELAKLLAENNNKVYIFGLEQKIELKNIKNIEICENTKQAIEKSQIIIGPIPFSKDNININTPFSKKIISIKELFNNLDDKLFIAGNIKEELYELINNNSKIIDIMNVEELTILNVISTVEGAIQIAMENTNKILHGSNILILGFGRIGKILAKKLEGLSCKVTCSARKIEDFSWIKAYGYEPINLIELKENLNRFDIIINTIPYVLLDREMLQEVRKDAFIIDLASNPGGVDKQAIKDLGIKFNWALSLPGKVSPLTSAEFMKETLYNMFKEIN